MRRRRRRRDFGAILLAKPWEQVGPGSFVRREEIGLCGEVVASVSCPRGGVEVIGPRHRIAPKIRCEVDIRYTDPLTDVVMHAPVRHGTGVSMDKAAESGLLQADLAVSKLRAQRCYPKEVPRPIRYPSFAPELSLEEEELPLPPACKCRRWKKRGLLMERECGSGYSMRAGRAGFSLGDPVQVQLRRGGATVWQSQFGPLPTEAGQPDKTEKRARREVTNVLRAMCLEEEE